MQRGKINEENETGRDAGDGRLDGEREKRGEKAGGNSRIRQPLRAHILDIRRRVDIVILLPRGDVVGHPALESVIVVVARSVGPFLRLVDRALPVRVVVFCRGPAVNLLNNAAGGRCAGIEENLPLIKPCLFSEAS